jgi:hypothetical protein
MPPWCQWFLGDRIRGRVDRSGLEFEAILPLLPHSAGRIRRSALERSEGVEAIGERDRPASCTPLFPAPTGVERLFRRILGGRRQWRLGRLSSDPFRSGRVEVEPLCPLRGGHRADPFWIRHDDRDWLLFEEELPGDRGRLRIAEFAEGDWRVLEGEILERSHHLSWPNVFELDGRLLLLPETGSAGEVVLFESEEFPFRWRKVRTLLAGRPWHDPCLLRHEGLWWLFASPGGGDPRDHSAELRAFWARDLFVDEFRPHALNPPSLSVCGARPAGAPFLHEGTWHRPVQDCRGGYGSGILVQRIDRLSPGEWAETTVAHLLPPEGATGLHTLNRFPDGGWVVDFLS